MRIFLAGSPSVYINLTNIHGQAHFELRYADLKDESVLFKAEFMVDCKNPLQPVELGLPLPMLPRPHDGVYALELIWDGELLGSQRVIVEKMPESPAETTGDLE